MYKILGRLYGLLFWMKSLVGDYPYNIRKSGIFYKKINNHYRRVEATVRGTYCCFGYSIYQTIETREITKTKEYGKSGFTKTYNDLETICITYTIARNVDKLGLITSFITDMLTCKNSLVTIDKDKNGDSAKCFIKLDTDEKNLKLSNDIIYKIDEYGLVHVYGASIDVITSCQVDEFNTETVLAAFYNEVR